MMKEKDKSGNNVLRQALENRRGQGLPSNFSFRMMEKVRIEAEKKRKRQRNIVWLSLAGGCVFILGLLGFVLYNMQFDLMEYLPKLNINRPSGEITDFYSYIAVLVVILLALDYWLRSRRKKYLDE